LSDEETRFLESEAKYEGYIRKQEREISRTAVTDLQKIPGSLDFRRVPGLTREAAERLSRFAPETLGAARKISGITPSDVHNLGLYLEIIRKRAHVSRGTRRKDE
jgi:tRNA uridine 5-carboxymethylaminomethyl modification enzyme